MAADGAGLDEGTRGRVGIDNAGELGATGVQPGGRSLPGPTNPVVIGMASTAQA